MAKKSIVFLTPTELLALLKEARQRSLRDWCMILVAYQHGMRCTEVCQLRLGDIDLRAGQITIRRLKGSMHTVQQLMPHRGQPLLDEVKAFQKYLGTRPTDA